MYTGACDLLFQDDGHGGLTPLHYMVKTGDKRLIESTLDMLTPEAQQNALRQHTANVSLNTCTAS